MKHFLYIFEDGGLIMGDSPTQEEYESVERGVITIVNTKTNQVYQGSTNEWEPIPVWHNK